MIKPNFPFENFGVMLDNSRNAVMKPEVVKKYIDIMSDLGYNFLMLYTEDTYEIKGRPYFGHNRGRYTTEELKELDLYAEQKGVCLIPCIQTLAHLNAIFRWPCFSQVNDCGDILLVDEEETYRFIDDMFATISETFTCRTVNIGMDEAYMLGRGKYKDLHGAQNGFDILHKHLLKVSELAKKYDFELIMWGDMFFHLPTDGSKTTEDLKSIIPDNVHLIYWDYTVKDRYNDRITAYSQLEDDLWFAGALWTFTGLAPHNDFSMRSTRMALEACVNQRVKNIIVTLWGDDGAECSKFSVLPSLYYTAEIAKGNVDIDSIKQGFYEKFGITFDDFMLLDLPGTPNDTPDIINTEKYMFYNDCLMGLFDSTVKGGEGKSFRDIALKLEKFAEHKEYGLLFDSLAKLSGVLEIKYELGFHTREAYLSGNKTALRNILPDYDETISRIEEFYKAYEKQWMWENKPHGFDVQDARIGALIQRVKHCRDRIKAYLDGELIKIEELEEPLLDVKCREESEPLCFKFWSEIITSNVMHC